MVLPLAPTQGGRHPGSAAARSGCGSWDINKHGGWQKWSQELHEWPLTHTSGPSGQHLARCYLPALVGLRRFMAPGICPLCLDSAGPGRPLVAPCGQDVVQVTAESRQTLVWISAAWARAGIVQNTAEMAASLLKKLVV